MQKILIVEDDLAIQALLHDFIQEAGYEVTLASDGVEALSYFSERSFDLVLLDIILYGYPNCPHHFQNGRCANCCWDGSESTYIKSLKVN